MLPKTPAAQRLCLLALMLFGATAQEAKAQGSGIPWLKDLGRASEAAKKTNQPMMIEFWADWCEPCRLMDVKVYSDPRLIAAVRERIVPVRIHFDLQQDLARKYNVPALPYLIFTNSNGTELLHRQGIIGADALTAVIKALPADVSEFNRLDRALQENRNNFESLVAMGRGLRAAGFFRSSNDYYARAAEQDEVKGDPGRREPILFEMGLNLFELREARQAAQIFEKCLKEFPRSPNRPDVLLNLAKSYALSGQKAKARTFLETLLAEFPQSDASRQAGLLLRTL